MFSVGINERSLLVEMIAFLTSVVFFYRRSTIAAADSVPGFAEV